MQLEHAALPAPHALDAEPGPAGWIGGCQQEHLRGREQGRRGDCGSAVQQHACQASARCCRAAPPFHSCAPPDPVARCRSRWSPRTWTLSESRPPSTAPASTCSNGGRRQAAAAVAWWWIMCTALPAAPAAPALAAAAAAAASPLWRAPHLWTYTLRCSKEERQAHAAVSAVGNGLGLGLGASVLPHQPVASCRVQPSSRLPIGRSRWGTSQGPGCQTPRTRCSLWGSKRSASRRAAGFHSAPAPALKRHQVCVCTCWCVVAAAARQVNAARAGNCWGAQQEPGQQ